jgi:hypothetical protein
MHNPQRFKLCGHCGSPLREEEAAPAAWGLATAESQAYPAPVEEALPLAAHVNAGKTYRDNSLDFIEIALTNLTGSVIGDVTVRVSGKLIENTLSERAGPPLMPQQPVPVRVSGFLPKTVGKDMLALSIEGNLADGTAFYLKGSAPVTVAPRDDGMRNVNVNISAKGPLIVDMEDALPQLRRGRREEREPQEDRWAPIALALDLERRAEASRFFPDASVQPSECGLEKDVLAALQALSPETAPKATVTCHNGFTYNIVCGATLLLGRKRGANHVPAYLYPEDQNEHANVKVSRSHCRLSVKDNRIFACDMSNNGTFLDGQRLKKNEETPVASGQQLGIAGILDMRVDIFTDGGRVLAVRLTRLHNRTLDHYILAPGPVPMGPGENMPIQVHGAPSFLAAFYHDPLKGLWFLRTIRGFSGASRDVAVKTGQKVRFGQATCVFTLG